MADIRVSWKRNGVVKPLITYALLAGVLGMFLFPGAVFAKKTALPKGSDVQGKTTSGVLKVTVFEVGKGDAILLSLPDGRFAMIDTGYAETASRMIQQLKKWNVNRLSLVVLTHHDKDHVGGYPHLVEALPIERVIQSYDPRDKKKTVLVKVGTKLIDEDGVVLEVLAPSQPYKDENDASLVLRLTYGDTSFLFAGDIVEKAQADLLQQGISLRANVLKVPHHAQYKGFSPRAFFAAVNPSLAVITSDEKNAEPPEGSVVKMLEEAGVKVLRTDRRGTFALVSDGKKVVLEEVPALP